MANKKATCYILNVSHAMSLYPDNVFSKSLQTITCSIEDRVLAGRKTDLVSLILCGTPETKNSLADSTPGQYENISVMSPLAMPTVQLLKDLSNVTTAKESDRPADVLDALIVAIDTISTHCRHLKYTKRVVIFTDNKSAIDWLDLSDVSEMLKSNSIEVTLIGADKKELELPDCSEVVKTNYEYWDKLISSCDGDIADLEEAYAQTQIIYAKEVAARPSYRGFLYIGSPYANTNFLPISINTYLRTKVISLPSAKKVSSLSEGPTKKVEQDTKFILDIENEGEQHMSEVEVEKHDIQKGYKFGKTILLISNEELGMSKLETKKEMSIIGFVPSKQVPRQYLFSNAVVLTSGIVRVEQSSNALAALAEALYETDRYALVRFVSNDGVQPKLGILLPELNEVCPILLYFDIPFDQDIRKYKLKTTVKPGDVDSESLDLMSDLIHSMDLDVIDEDFLAPETIFNPIAWRFKTAIKTRALNDNAPIPDLDKRFDDQYKLNPFIESKINDIEGKMLEHFNIRKVQEKGKKRTFGLINDSEPVSMDDILDTASSDSRKRPNMDTDTLPALIQNKVEVIGLTFPVEEYQAMLARTDDDEDIVEKANKLMHQVIITLLNRSFGNVNYKKAISCLVALRKTCAAEDDASRYNSIIQEVKSWCTLSTDSPRREIWNMLKENGLGIISNEECQDVDIKDVTKEVAEKFWNETEEKVSETENNDDDERFDADNLDDLF
ncbi:SPOC like C-terminal domain-containing protein [Thamnidium elegans]|nr:SPOC like C-terminal domain-containing protein [Thamnidium elegans]